MCDSYLTILEPENFSCEDLWTMVKFPTPSKKQFLTSIFGSPKIVCEHKLNKSKKFSTELQVLNTIPYSRNN